jgi:hypothetical protein
MPKCLNDKTKTYKGDEPSPKGLGISASAEEDGKIMQGKDNNLWKVKLTSNGQKRWSKVKDEIPKKENTATDNASTCQSEKLVAKEKEEKIKSTIRQAVFHNIVDEIFPHYQRTGCIGLKNDKYNEEIEKYISENTYIKCGDILFVGPNSVSLPRDEDGFCIVLNDGKFETSVGVKGPFLAIDNSEILSHKVSYKLMFETMKSDEFAFRNFFDDEESYDDFVEDYKKNNMW